MPKDFRSKTFQKVLRGYAPEEVAEYLTYVDSEYHKLERQCNDNARKLTIALSKLDAVSTRLRETEEQELSAAASEEALKTADDIMAEAKQKADQMLADAKAKSARMMNEALDRAKQLLEGATGKADSIIREADAEGKQMKTDSRALYQASENLYGEVCRFRDTLFDLYNTHIELVEHTVEEAGGYYDKIRGTTGKPAIGEAPAETEEEAVPTVDVTDEADRTDEHFGAEETFSAFDTSMEESHAVLHESKTIEAFLTEGWDLSDGETEESEKAEPNDETETDEAEPAEETTPEAVEEFEEETEEEAVEEAVEEAEEEADDEFEDVFAEEEPIPAQKPAEDFIADLFADEDEETEIPDISVDEEAESPEVPVDEETESEPVLTAEPEKSADNTSFESMMAELLAEEDEPSEAEPEETEEPQESEETEEPQESEETEEPQESEETEEPQESEEAEAPAVPKDMYIDPEDGSVWDSLVESADPKLAADFKESAKPTYDEPIDIDDLTPEELSELLLQRLLSDTPESTETEQEDAEPTQTFDELLAMKPEEVSAKLLDDVFGGTDKYVEVVSSQPTYTPEEPEKKRSIL